MKYVISKSGNLTKDYVEISEDEFNQIKSAQNKLLEILYLEEKLDFVVENYLEFEIDLLRMAAENIMHHNDNSISRNNDRNLLNRRIMNLLSVCKSYLSQSTKHVNNMYGSKSKISNEFNDLQSNYYDNVFGYRFLVKLRNYVQHYDVPVNIIGFHHEIDRNENHESKFSHKVIPYIRLSQLENDKIIKQKIITELKSFIKDDRIDLRKFIREYVESIGKIHETFREMIKSDLNSWEKIYLSSFDKIKNITSEKQISFVSLIAIYDNKKWKERVPLPKNILERRELLELKNRQFHNLHLCYATNQL